MATFIELFLFSANFCDIRSVQFSFPMTLYILTRNTVPRIFVDGKLSLKIGGLDKRPMGSLGEEELVQMVRDFIESETPSSISLTPSGHPPLNYQPTSLILQEFLGKNTDEEAEIHEKILMYLKDKGTAGHQTNKMKNLVVMSLRNDGYEAYLCKTSWVCTSSHHKVFQLPGRYEYIDVMVVENGRPKRVIVDMEFRSQFELARPTVTYKEMINILPLIFVGTEEKLNRIIPLLCSAAKRSLKENGLHVPPWRRPAYMQSKWLSKNCNKVSVLSPQDIDFFEDHHHKTEEKSTTTCFSSLSSRIKCSNFV